MRVSRALMTTTALLLGGAASAFELKLASPAFELTVPALPAIRVDAATPPARPDAAVALAGRDARYQVDVVVTPTAPPATTRTCAGSSLRALVARPGMPGRDSIYRAPLDGNTFLVLYILGPEGNRRLHAHLLSSTQSAYCIDAHFSRALVAGDDEERWRESFAGAHVRSADH